MNFDQEGVIVGDGERLLYRCVGLPNERIFQGPRIKSESITTTVVRVSTPLSEIISSRAEATDEVVTGPLNLSEPNHRLEISGEQLALPGPAGGFAAQNADRMVQTVTQFGRVIDTENIREPEPSGFQNASQSHMICVVIQDWRGMSCLKRFEERIDNFFGIAPELREGISQFRWDSAQALLIRPAHRNSLTKRPGGTVGRENIKARFMLSSP